jgi:hypothetical protein
MAMNERIQQLAEQAGIKLPDSLEYNGHVYRNSIERFARLIVDDSIGVLIDYLEEIDKEQKTPSFIGMSMTINRIREHFGVEA